MTPFTAVSNTAGFFRSLENGSIGGGGSAVLAFLLAIFIFLLVTRVTGDDKKYPSDMAPPLVT